MVINDTLAYIPLLFTAVCAFASIVMLLINIKHWNMGVFLLHLISSVFLCGGAVCTVIFPSVTLFAVAVAVATFLKTIAVILQSVKEKRAKEEAAETERLEAERLEIQQAAEKNAEETENQETDKYVHRLVESGREFMIQAANAFSDESGLNKLLDHANNALIRETKADGGVVLLLDDFDDVLVVKTLVGDFPPPYKLPEDLPHKIVRVETNFRFSQFPLNETIFGAVARSGKAELVTDPLSDSRIYQNETEDFLKCGTYIFLPLKIRDTVIGVAALARNFASQPFTEDDFRVATVLADFMSTSIKVLYSYQEVVDHAELTKESGIACKLQKSLHPKLLPAIPMLSIGCYYNTAEGVCGDYYDVIPARKDRISFVVGDIAGKGMNSLMVMVMLRAMLRLTVNTTQSAGTILGWANRGIAGEINIDHFASIALINYDSTNNNIQIATAGDTPILHYSVASDTIEQVSETNEPVGVEKTTVYKDKDFTVQSGDIIVTYTDGVVETPNASGMQYSQERIMELVKKNKNLTGKEIADVIKSDITKFSESSHQHDDQTLLIIKVQ